MSGHVKTFDTATPQAPGSDEHLLTNMVALCEGIEPQRAVRIMVSGIVSLCGHGSTSAEAAQRNVLQTAADLIRGAPDASDLWRAIEGKRGQ